jgi:hypothetical protein
LGIRLADSTVDHVENAKTDLLQSKSGE